jgi:hypothetical protein
LPEGRSDSEKVVMEMLDIFDLTKTHQKKQEKRIEIYDEILRRCHKKIKDANSIDMSACRFTVPPFVAGLPIYQIKPCIAYLIIKLQNNGFDIFYEKPNTLYISWEKYRYKFFKEERRKLLTSRAVNPGMPQTAITSQLLLGGMPQNAITTVEPVKQTIAEPIDSTSYITKYFKDLNSKYLHDD